MAGSFPQLFTTCVIMDNAFRVHTRSSGIVTYFCLKPLSSDNLSLVSPAQSLSAPWLLTMQVALMERKFLMGFGQCRGQLSSIVRTGSQQKY